MNEGITITPLNSDAKVIKPVETVQDLRHLTIDEFVQTEAFKTIVADIAKQTNKSVIDVGNSLINSTLGTVSDTGVRAVNTVENFINNLTDTVASAIKGVNKTVCDLGKDSIKTVTLGKGNDDQALAGK